MRNDKAEELKGHCNQGHYLQRAHIMKHSEQLHTLLTENVIPEMETFMRKLQEHIDASGMTDDLKRDQQGILAHML